MKDSTLKILLPYAVRAAKYAGKALYAGTVAFVGVAVASTIDGSGLSQPEFWTGIGSAVFAVGGVFGIRNGLKPGA